MHVSIPFRGFRRAEASELIEGVQHAVSIPFRGFRRAELPLKVRELIALGFNPLPRFPTC